MITCRVMLMLYELEVLQSDAERIGDPVALPLTDIINNGGNSNRLETTNAHQPTTAAGSNEREIENDMFIILFSSSTSTTDQCHSSRCKSITYIRRSKETER